MNKDRRREVLRIVRERFRLEWRGIYGVPHWARGADFALQLNSELLRLDLGRVGIVPGPDRLCTEQARDPLLLDRAYRRSVR
jgi:hypothetical protein